MNHGQVFNFGTATPSFYPTAPYQQSMGLSPRRLPTADQMFSAGHPQQASESTRASSSDAGDVGLSTLVTVSAKVINPSNKKDIIVFLFRAVPKNIISPNQLREEFLEQFGEDIVPNGDFPVGYFRGQQKVWIRTESDLKDAWSLLLKGSGSLWLHGVPNVPANSDEDQDTQPSSKRRKTTNKQSATDDNQERIEEIKQKLHEKHGSSYTPMQYRCWAELIAINSHTSYDDPPPYPMFNGG